jgi:hypothetical protein
MKVPVTSQKCPHSFEKDAIMEMIGYSSLRVGGSGGRRGADNGTKAIKCPVCQIVRFYKLLQILATYVV